MIRLTNLAYNNNIDSVFSLHGFWRDNSTIAHIAAVNGLKERIVLYKRSRTISTVFTIVFRYE